jgi:hypothetical protein
MRAVKFLEQLYVVYLAMKKTLCYFLGLLLLSPAVLHAQDRNEELVAWSDARKLTWNDYKADPSPESDAAASTTTYLAISYNIGASGFSYKIQSKFSKTRSWGRHRSEYILTHEQAHFDIAEIFARKLHQRMTEYKFNRRTYQKDLNKIYQEVVDEKEKMQNDYDEETNHSINKEKQRAWLKKIADLLDETAAWSDY